MSGLGAGAARRRRRGAAAWIAVLGVVVVGSAGLIAASDPSGPATGGTAAAFVPADGHTDWVLADGQPGPQQRESGRTVGASALFEFPEIARTAAAAAYTDAEMDAARHWSVTWRAAEPGAGAGDLTELSSLTDAGVRLVMSLGPLNSFIFQPGIVVLAGDVREGASWSGEGEGWWVAAPAAGQRPDEAVLAIRYTAEYAASVPRHPLLVEHAVAGCLQVDGQIELTDPGEAAGWTVALADASLWCPGRGAVASVSSIDGGPPSRTVPVAAPTLEAPETQGAIIDWPSRWAAHPVPVTHVDPLFGESAVALAPGLEPVEFGGGLAVADVNTGSVALFSSAAGSLRRTALLRTALLHPGGDVTAVGAVGELLVLGTTQRRVVAYTADGVRRWSAPIGDVLVAPPIAGADGTVLVAGLDGRVRSLDAATGEEEWSAAASADGIQQLTSLGGQAIALDRAGRIVALSAADGAIRWSREEEHVDTLSAAGDAVYVARDNGLLRLDAATGAPVWSALIGTGADAIAVLGSTVVVLSWSDVQAFDAATGALVWRAAGADRAATDGEVLVLDGRGPTRVLGPAGDVRADLDVTPEGAGSARFLVGAADGAWIVDSISGIVRVGS